MIADTVKAVGKTVLSDDTVRRARFKKRLSDTPDTSILVIVFDACRYDTFNAVYNNEFPADVYKAYAQACWTIPGHQCLVRGAFPASPDQSEKLLPDGCIGGYYPLPLQFPYSFGATAMPYLSKSQFAANPLPNYFTDWFCAENPVSADTVLEHSERFLDNADEPFFGLVNFGETHFPYGQYDGDLSDLLTDIEHGNVTYDQLHSWQKEQCQQLIRCVQVLQQHISQPIRIILTADHGELFGENDGYGHNFNKQAVFHRKLFEVPLVSWEVSA